MELCAPRKLPSMSRFALTLSINVPFAVIKPAEKMGGSRISRQ
jgi:hypothetical protein